LLKACPGEDLGTEAGITQNHHEEALRFVIHVMLKANHSCVIKIPLKEQPYRPLCPSLHYLMYKNKTPKTTNVINTMAPYNNIKEHY